MLFVVEWADYLLPANKARRTFLRRYIILMNDQRSSNAASARFHKPASAASPTRLSGSTRDASQACACALSMLFGAGPPRVWQQAKKSVTQVNSGFEDTDLMHSVSNIPSFVPSGMMKTPMRG